MNKNLIVKTFIISAILFSSCKIDAGIPLKEALKNDFLIGVAMNSEQITGHAVNDDKIICEQFNSIVAENCMKSEVIHPEQNRYNFTLSDKFVDFGNKHNMAVMGHALIWHSQLSRWFCFDKDGNKVSRDTLINRMRDHIYTIMRHYKGKVRGWDVVNEAFEDDGSYRNTLFYQIIGKDYIPLAFKFAHEADPDAELYYNDYSMFKPIKCDSVVKMAKNLKAMGLRIDAVGMQGHYLLDDPSVEDVEKSIVKLAAAGVKVNITEFDLSALPLPSGNAGANVGFRASYDKKLNPYSNGKLTADADAHWSKCMLDYFKLFLKYRKDIERVNMWGLSDGQSWKNNWPIFGRTDFPLLYNRNNKPKKVVDEIIKEANKINK